MISVKIMTPKKVRRKMTIRIAKTGYYRGLFNLLFKEQFSITKYWNGKIVNVGLDSIYFVLDFRKNWI